jgi:hypothetical protein
MLGIDPEFVTSALRLWIAAGSAAGLFVVCAIVFGRRRRRGFAASAARFFLVILGAIVVGSMTWVLNQNAARRALEARADELTAKTLTPGSPLACLEPSAGEKIELACERAVFASPATVATAIAYVAARFALLSDMVDYSRRGGADIDTVLLPLRRTLESDPFGFLAHVLVMRDGCTSENCKALELLRDPRHVRLNLIAETLDHYVEHYREVWAKSPDAPPVAELTEPQPSPTALANAPGQRKVTVNIDFPTAASIPPVSIMNPEPKTAVSPGAAANPNTEAAPAAQAPHPRKRGGKPTPEGNAQGAAPAPPPSEAAQGDPVWTPTPAQTTR